jgi:polysaccharide pyruvyl transferase WcaK-like protein
VLGNYGNRNLGDEATLQSVRQFVTERCPWAEVWALSERPPETRRRHGIEALPSIVDAGDAEEGPEPRPPLRRATGAPLGLRGRVKTLLKRTPALFAAVRALMNAPRTLREAGRYLRFSARSFVHLRAVDLLVVAGGGQLSDHFEGVWGFPLQLFSWCLLARCAGARVAVLNVGAGPIGGSGSRMLFRWTLRLAGYRSYRDERSRHLIAEIGVRGAGPVGPDLVFGWHAPGPEPAPAPGAGPTVALNVFPYRDWRYWPKYDPAAYAAYVDKIADVTSWLLEQGYRVRLFPTQLRADVRVIADVREKLADRLAGGLAERLQVASIATVDDVAREVRGADIVVATRFHAIVIAMLLGKPVLGLCNESKMTDLMAAMGQGAYALSLDTLDVAETIARFGALAADRERVAAELADRVAHARRVLDGQLDLVFGPRVGPAGRAATDARTRPTVARLDPSATPGPKPW